MQLPEISNPIELYHFVRKIPYGGIGQRSPDDVIRNGRGSCSGKHMLLAKLLGDVGFDARVATIFTWFDQDIPLHPMLPDELKIMLEEGEIPDYHHYVELTWEGIRLKLDATWHDPLKPFGFPVNDLWKGEGDTVIAAPVLEQFDPIDYREVPRFKQQLLTRLTPDQQQRRNRFFTLFSSWCSELS